MVGLMGEYLKDKVLSIQSEGADTADSADAGALSDLFGAELEENEEGQEAVVTVQTSYVRKPADAHPQVLQLELISSKHSLWGHLIWNAAILLAERFDTGALSCKGATVLELGAGAGLPGLVCALKGAGTVVISDYATETDQALIEVINRNIESVKPYLTTDCKLVGAGHVWGQSVSPLLQQLPPPSDMSEEATSPGFDLIILADLLFNRSQHQQLLRSCHDALSPSGRILVTFSHHDPEKAEQDLKFFSLAAKEPFNFTVQKLEQVQMVDHFIMNDGLDDARGVVYFYELRK